MLRTTGVLAHGWGGVCFYDLDLDLDMSMYPNTIYLCAHDTLEAKDTLASTVSLNSLTAGAGEEANAGEVKD